MHMLKNNSNLKICIVGELTGGVGVYGQNLLRGLTELGLSPTVITPTPENSPVNDVIPVKRYFGRGRWLPQAFTFCRAVKEHHYRFDIIHFTDARFSIFLPSKIKNVVGTMNDYFYAITSLLGSTGSAAVYEDWFFRHLYYNFTRILEGPTLRRLAKIVCIADEVKTILGNSYHIAQDKCHVVQYGIDYGDIVEDTFSYPGKMVLFTGGNFQRKGLNILIQASVKILQSYPDTRFVIVGSSADLNMMKKQCQDHGVLNSFDFVGQVDYKTLYQYYCSADVFTMPSILEAFGIPYLEAMHCGVPVVASDVPGPSDYLRDRSNCIVAKAGDATQLSNGILELLNDEELRKSLIDGGKKTAAEFTVSRMTKSTYEAYEYALGLK